MGPIRKPRRPVFSQRDSNLFQANTVLAVWKQEIVMQDLSAMEAWECQTLMTRMILWEISVLTATIAPQVNIFR